MCRVKPILADGPASALARNSTHDHALVAWLARRMPLLAERRSDSETKAVGLSVRANVSAEARDGFQDVRSRGDFQPGDELGSRGGLEAYRGPG